MKVRYSIVHAIVTSWEEVSRDILLKGWEKSGIFPFNMNKGLQNTLTNQVIIPNNQTNVFSISNKDLSLPINRLQIAQKKYGVITVPNIIFYRMLISQIYYVYIFPDCILPDVNFPDFILQDDNFPDCILPDVNFPDDIS